LLSTSATTASNVGSYAIAAMTTGLAANYAITIDSDGTLTVTPATLTITATPDQWKVYGNSDPAFTFTASGWKLSDGSGLFTGGLGRNSGEDAGSYGYTLGNLSAGGNYTLSLASGAFFSIEPAPLILTVRPANGQSKTYGAADPIFVYTTFGWHAGDGPALLTGLLGRDAGENVGFYDYTLGTLSAGQNYTVTLIGGIQFQITPATLFITPVAGQGRFHGQSDPLPYLYYASGWQFTDDETLLSGLLGRLPGDTVGVYAYTFGDLSAGANYVLAWGAPIDGFTIRATAPQQEPPYTLAAMGLHTPGALGSLQSMPLSASVGEWFPSTGETSSLDGSARYPQGGYWSGADASVLQRSGGESDVAKEDEEEKP
jgi:hypothetical protein